MTVKKVGSVHVLVRRTTGEQSSMTLPYLERVRCLAIKALKIRTARDVVQLIWTFHDSDHRAKVCHCYVERNCGL
jgi:hypothetical protein